MDTEEARHILDAELDGYRQMTYSQLAARSGSSVVVTRRGQSGTEYTIELDIMLDDPRKSQGNLRIVASIDDGRLPSSITPFTRGFLMTPDGDRFGE